MPTAEQFDRLFDGHAHLQHASFTETVTTGVESGFDGRAVFGVGRNNEHIILRERHSAQKQHGCAKDT